MYNEQQALYEREAVLLKCFGLDWVKPRWKALNYKHIKPNGQLKFNF